MNPVDFKSGVTLSFDDPGSHLDELAFFAIRPLSTELMEGVVDGISYRGIDLNQWARNFLGIFDLLLDPGIAAVITILDKKTGASNHSRLLAQKEKLAGKIVTGLTHLIVDQQGSAELALARKQLLRRLLDKLATAYSIQSIVRVNALVNAAGSVLETTGKTGARVPFPIRECPGIPLLVRQSGTAADVPTSPVETLDDVIFDSLKWKYEVEVRRAWAHQDTLCFTLGFDEDSERIDSAKSAGITTDWRQELFVQLARFENRAIEIKDWIDSLAEPARVTRIADPPEEPGTKIARFVELVEGVAEAWPDYATAPSDQYAERLDEIGQYSFFLQQDAVDPESMTLFGSCKEEDDPVWPIVADKEGRTGKAGTAVPCGSFPSGDASDATNLRWYRRTYSFDAAPNPDGWKFQWTSFSMRDRQSARFTAKVLRNENLFHDRRTNPEFVYRSPTAEFADPLIPLIERQTLPKLKPVSSFAEALLQIFEPFRQASRNGEYWLKLESTFSYPVVPASPEPHVSIPVLLANGVDVSSADACMQSANSLAKRHSDWFADMQPRPPADSGEIHLSLTLLKTVAGSRQPIVLLGDVPIGMGTTPDWWREFDGDPSKSNRQLL